MPNVIIALPPKQARIPGCIVENARANINAALKARHRVRPEITLRKLVKNFSYIDSNFTLYSNKAFLARTTGPGTTELTITIARYKQIRDELVADRDKWIRQTDNAALSDEFLIDQFATNVWPDFEAGWDEILTAFSAADRPRRGEVGKP